MAGDSRGPTLADYLEGLLAMLEDFVADATLHSKGMIHTRPLDVPPSVASCSAARASVVGVVAAAESRRVAIIATVQSLSGLHPKLQTIGSLALAVELPPPSREGRIEVRRWTTSPY